MGQPKVCIVGGGLGGLAAACTLAARGLSVQLFERNGWLGGKAAVLHQDGFRFDMGPTILTMPSVLRRIVGEAGRALPDLLELIELDPQWRLFYEDGSRLDLHGGLDAMQEELRKFTGGDGVAQGYARFLAMSEHLHEITDRYFFWQSVGSLGDVFHEEEATMLRTLWDIMHMKPGQTVAHTVRHHLGDPRVAQMADHFTQYVGSSPYKAPAILCSIAHIQTGEGEWYPVGGTRAVPVMLADLASELGAELHTKTAVTRILEDSGRAVGVMLESGERVEADAVVCNMDVVRAYRELLAVHADSVFESRRAHEPACSGVVLYIGLRERYEHLLHHNFVFSRDPEEEFDAIYERGVPAPDPTCYVCAPSASDATVAPGEGEALYVLVHAPHLRPDHNWHRMLPAYREKILDKLEGTGCMPDIRDRIVQMRALTPQDIRDRYTTLEGAIYGLASHGRLTGAFKPANRCPDLGGLYFGGGSVHPGPGMPMALMSGWVAADCAATDLAASAPVE